MPLGPHLTWHQEETGYDTQLGGGGEAVSFEGFLSVLHSSADVVLRPPVPPPHPPVSGDVDVQMTDPLHLTFVPSL